MATKSTANVTGAVEPQNVDKEMEAYKLAKAISNAPAWMPGDNPEQSVIRGKVVGLHLGRDNGYGVYPVITYDVDSMGPDEDHMQPHTGYLRVHAFHVLLRTQLAEAQTTLGIRQILSYSGMVTKNNPTEDEIAKGLDKYHSTFVQNIGAEFKAVADNFTF